MESKVEQYVAKGCHHLRQDEQRFQFEELAGVLLSDFPTTESVFTEIAQLDLDPLEQVFDDIECLEGIPDAAKMTSARRQQIMRLLQEGQMRLIRTLEEQ